MLTPGSEAISSVVAFRIRSALRRASARGGPPDKFDTAVKISSMTGNRPPFADGQPVYLQIPATDIEASARFYGDVFGWKVSPPGSEFEAPGLIGQWITDRAPAPDAGPVMWIHVDDLSDTLERAQRADAAMVDQPTP